VSPNRLALDACVLINLCATARTVEIAATLNVRFVVPRQVCDETFYLLPPNGIGQPRIPIELDALVGEGALEIVDLRSDELITFVAAAARLDDGEAAVLSVAVHRGLALATDDRAALRLIAVQHPVLKILSTSQLMRHYCEQAQLAAHEAAACVVAIEARASFVAPSTDPEAQWWGSTRADGG
jgi:predicted nucleic acid-binding protein